MSTETLTVAALTVMKHARGWDRGAFRNHFVIGPGSTEWPVVQGLCGRGLMKQTRAPSELTGGDSSFSVTERGDAAITAYCGPPRQPQDAANAAKWVALGELLTKTQAVGLNVSLEEALEQVEQRS